MKKTACILLALYFIVLSFAACSSKETKQPKANNINTTTENSNDLSSDSTDDSNSESAYTPAEQTTINCFKDLCYAVENDTSGTYASIVLGTPAHSAIVVIEKNYKENKDSKIITQMYYYAEVVSLLSATNRDDDYDSKYNQAVIYASQIDQSYDGPFSKEIKTLSKKYADESIASSKNALNMSAQEIAEVKSFIQERFDYYDSINGGYAGDKYVTTVWEETAIKFGITSADIDIIWYYS